MSRAAQAAEDGAGGVTMLDVATLDPETFWAQHIAPRKPALIRGHPTDLAWRASSLWSDEYLIRKAGHARVLVEVRQGPGEGYGRGVKRRMAFGEFVRRVAAGDTNLYLTAQQVAVAPDGHPELMAEPLTSLAGGAAGAGGAAKGAAAKPGAAEAAAAAAAAAKVAGSTAAAGAAGATSGCPDFPACPQLAGHLVPQSLNMWMGAAPEGSSSGLHHDFHDNLYVLLRGAKRFTLYPPEQAPNMYTHGKIARVHANGRIVYEGQGEILPDGTDAREVARWRQRTHAEAAVAEAEAALQRGERGAAERLEAAEAALEEALEAELSDAWEEQEEEEEEDMEEEDGDMEEDEDEEDDEEEEQEEEGKQEVEDGGKAEEDSGCSRNLSCDFDAVDGRAASKGAAKGAKGGGKKKGGNTGDEEGLIIDPDTPPSFSRVPLGDPRVSGMQLAAAFPRFPGRAAGVEVTVEAGCMLYLPAGWFHEVTSFGSAAGGSSSGSSGSGGGHLAFNYWFHPPDNLDPNRRGFRAPYKSDFWPALWRARVAAGLPGCMEAGMGAQQPPRRAAAGAGGDGEEAEAEEMVVDASGTERNGAGPTHGSAAPLGAPGSEKRKRRKAEQGAEEADPAAADAVLAGGSSPRRVRVRLSGEADTLQPPQPEQQQQQQQPGEESKAGLSGLEAGDAGEDLDPPRRRTARSILAELAARAQRAGVAVGNGVEGGAGAGAGAGEGGGGDGQQNGAVVAAGEERPLSEQEYQLLMALQAAQQRSAVMAALRAHMERRLKLRRLLRMRARLPPGRRHHPVIVVPQEVRLWRPAEPQQGKQGKQGQGKQGQEKEKGAQQEGGQQQKGQGPKGLQAPKQKQEQGRGKGSKRG